MLLQIIVLLLILILFHNFYWKRKDLPPGPTPLPVLGNMLSFTNNQMDKAIFGWHKKYGDVVTIWMGRFPIVTVNDVYTIFDTFQKDGEAYAGRFTTAGFASIRGAINGVIQTEGDLWREHRRFALHVLRDFGLGRNLMQEKILDEVTSLVDDIKGDIKNGIKAISIQNDIDRCIGSIINALTFGYRFGRDREAEFQKNKRNINTLLKSFTNMAWRIMAHNMEFLKHFPYFKPVYQRIKKEAEDVFEFYFNQIDSHKKKINFDIDDEPTDYAEAYLRQQHKLEKSGQKDHTFSDNQLFGMLFDLWLAGQETTATTLGWLCLYLIRNPEIQKKVHDELDRVFGSDRVVTLDDKNELNYINAVIAETQRFCNLIPFNVLHKTTNDVEIQGYKIPKGTAITLQVACVMFDEKYFKDPYVFNPDRFIDENGKFFTPPEFIPFGVGKRACLGEGLARMELFLFTANIFNQMRLLPENGIIPSDERVIRGTSQPHPYKTEIEFRY